MRVDSILALGGAIVVLAGVAVAVKSPFTSQLVTSIGNAFSGSVKAATAG